MTERRDDGEPDGPLDIEARFADIVAHFDEEAPGRSGPPGGTGAAQREEPLGRGGRGDAGKLPRRDDSTRRGEPAGPDNPVHRDGTAGPHVGPRHDDTGPHDRPRHDDTGQRDEPSGPDDLAALRPGQPLAGPPPVEPVIETEAERRARIEREIDAAVDGPDGGHFVPPDPPPVPRQDLPVRLAWLAVVLGPVLLVLAAMLWRGIPDWLLASIIVAIIAGFALLVSRMPRNRDDDSNDGAQV